MEEVSDAIRFEIIRQFLLDAVTGNPRALPESEAQYMASLLEGERRLVRELSARLIRRHFRFGHSHIDTKLVEHIARLVEGEGVDDEWRDHEATRTD